MEMLTKLHDTRKGEFDHVVIETTGLANPAPIIQTFYLEHALLENFRVDGVVTLVDAKHAHLHLDEVKPDGVVNEALEQIAFADRIVLNKTDLVTEETELNGLHRRIREINALAEIQRATKAKVPLDFTLGIGGFDLEKVQEAVMGKEQQQQQKDGHGHSHDEHEHECARCRPRRIVNAEGTPRRKTVPPNNNVVVVVIAMFCLFSLSLSLS